MSFLTHPCSQPQPLPIGRGCGYAAYDIGCFLQRFQRLAMSKHSEAAQCRMWTAELPGVWDMKKRRVAAPQGLFAPDLPHGFVLGKRGAEAVKYS